MEHCFAVFGLDCGQHSSFKLNIIHLLIAFVKIICPIIRRFLGAHCVACPVIPDRSSGVTHDMLKNISIEMQEIILRVKF
jgi:hypothetical protein